MGFRSVRTYQFRNLQDGETDLDAPEVFLVGENGQGKSNFLEALYLLCFGSSFRTKDESLLTRFGEKEMALRGDYASEGRVPFELSLRMAEGQKRISLDGKVIQDRRDLIAAVPCIIFCHDDISFAVGPPERRRWFFNQIMSLYDPLFIDTLRAYQKILRQRNAVLKAGGSSLLDVYDIQLAEVGTEIVEKRRAAVDEFNETFTELYGKVSRLPGDCVIRYMPSWKGHHDCDAAAATLRERREDDVRMGTTGTGPHRDRFIFFREGRNFSSDASTGQMRLISLVLRVSQAVFFSRKTGKKPVLLLDDVLLEIDGKRRVSFLESLPPYEQAVYTFLPDEPYQHYLHTSTAVYRVSDGTLRRVAR
jgi:DNA replication and repair protein RecF